jgi:hypothetical protein
MTPRNENFDTFFTWLERSKTIWDVISLIASVGVASAIRAFLAQSTSIPQAWLTTIWILTSALILWIVAIVFRKTLVQGEFIKKGQFAQRSSILYFGLIVAGIFFLVGRYSADTRPELREWQAMNKALEPEMRKTYVNQEVELDGKWFDTPTFQNVTLVYRGLKPYKVSNARIQPPVVFKVVDGPQAGGVSFVNLFDALCDGHKANCDVRGITGNVVDEKLNVIQP